MQTRTLAAAIGVLAALAPLPLAHRPLGARPMPAVAAAIAPRSLAATSPSDRPAMSGPSDKSARSDAIIAAPLPPEARADLALNVFDPVKRTRQISEALRAWAETDAGSALVWLDSHPEQETALLAQSIGEGLARDPGAITFALTYLAQDRELGSLLAGALVRALAGHGDATAAVQLASAAPEGWTHEWMTVAFTNLAYEDAATALEQLDRTDDATLRCTMAGAIIAGWAERDPAELAQHADVFDSSAEQNSARQLALTKWQQRDPVAAAAFLSAAPRS